MTLTPLRSDLTIEPFYPGGDGQPMAENDFARDSLIYAVAALKLYFQNRPEVYVSGNMYLYQFDPTGDYLDPPLIGFRWVDGAYQPMISGGSEAIAIRSPGLGLELRVEGGELRFYDPETGQKLLSYNESETERLQAEAQRLQAETSRREEQAKQERAEIERQQAVEQLYSGAERLLATGMPVEQVAAILKLEADDLRQRFDASVAPASPDVPEPGQS